MSSSQALWYRLQLDRLLKPWYSGIGSILMFHRVLPTQDKPRLSSNASLEVSPELLEQIIQFGLQQGYKIVSLDELHNTLQSQHKPKKPLLAFTFDDGYQDNADHAYPIFKKYQIPMTIYVTNSFPNRTHSCWWYALEALLLGHNALELTIAGATLSIVCPDLDSKNAAFRQVRTLLLSQPQEQLNQIVQTAFEPYISDFPNWVASQTMSWDCLKVLADDPLVSIGAHTLNHYALSQLDERTALDELVDSKLELETKLGKPVDHFAYPYGTPHEAKAREFQLAQMAGFKTATTTRSGNIFLKHNRTPMALPRITITEQKFGAHPEHLRLHLNGLSPAIKNKFKQVITL